MKLFEVIRSCDMTKWNHKMEMRRLLNLWSSKHDQHEEHLEVKFE